MSDKVDEFHKTIVEKLETFRIENNLSKARFGKIIGEYPSNYYKIIAGERKMSIKKIIQIAESLHCDFVADFVPRYRT